MHSLICVESSLCGKHSQEGNHWAANQIHHARMGFIMFLKPMDALEDHLLTCEWTQCGFHPGHVWFGFTNIQFGLGLGWANTLTQVSNPYPSANLVELGQVEQWFNILVTGSTYPNRLGASLVRVRSGISTRWALFRKIGLDYLFAFIWAIVAAARLVGWSLFLNNEAIKTARWQ